MGLPEQFSLKSISIAGDAWSKIFLFVFFCNNFLCCAARF
jgi:hypothetical protein